MGRKLGCDDLAHRARAADFEKGAHMRRSKLYDELERALIALEYALADARALDEAPLESEGVARSQDALQSAGEEVQGLLFALRASAMQSAAARVRHWH